MLNSQIKGARVSKNIGIIPARMESSRFPGKPMALIHGIPMIGHVYLRSKMSKSLDEIYVATCNAEIFDYITKVLGGKAIMTSPDHQRATDRTAEAIDFIEKETQTKVEIIIMIQGDEPTVTPRMIDTAFEAFVKLQKPTVLNLYAPIKKQEEFVDPNEIKVVLNKEMTKALYFSREAIPTYGRNKSLNYAYKQVCIMPFRKEFLKIFKDTAPTKLEEIESIDMMRLLENEIPVYMAECPDESYSVDNEDDLLKVTAFMENDDLMKAYLK